MSPVDMGRSNSELFLIGGGWENPEVTFGPFVKASADHGGGPILIILSDEDQVERLETESRYQQPFLDLGLDPSALQTRWIGDHIDFNPAEVLKTTYGGVFVGGGTTPIYHKALCENVSWMHDLMAQDIPYCGFSAGAAIAPHPALIGGWKLRYDERNICVVDEDCSEGLEWVTVRPGLNLIPFSIEVHASQWGNLTRLIHAVDQGLTKEGIAIDEDTLLHIKGDRLSVQGAGKCFHVHRKDSERTQVEIYGAGESVIWVDVEDLS